MKFVLKTPYYWQALVPIREYLGNWNLTLIETGYGTLMYAISCFHIAAQPTQAKTAVIVIPHFLSAVTLIICCMLIIWLWSILSETSILYQWFHFPRHSLIFPQTKHFPFVLFKLKQPQLTISQLLRNLHFTLGLVRRY